jgi:hypothetical protein
MFMRLLNQVSCECDDTPFAVTHKPIDMISQTFVTAIERSACSPLKELMI